MHSEHGDSRHPAVRVLAIGPDSKLYVNVGAPCNICEPPPAGAQIRRLNLDGTGAEVYASGVRQSVPCTSWQLKQVTPRLYI